MDNDLLHLEKNIYTVPLLLKRDEGVTKAGLCISSMGFEELIKHCHQFLHKKELIYFDTLKYAKRQFSFLLGRFCAKQAIQVCANVADYTSISIENGIFEQPFVVSPLLQNIQVSISHSETLGGAVAFPEAHPLGLDIEVLNPKNLDTIKTQITNAEHRLITPKFSYCHLWTAKEALSKVLRTGFMINMELLEIQSHETNEKTSISYFKYFHQYQALSFPLKQSICTLVHPRKTQIDLDINDIDL